MLDHLLPHVTKKTETKPDPADRAAVRLLPTASICVDGPCEITFNGRCRSRGRLTIAPARVLARGPLPAALRSNLAISLRAGQSFRVDGPAEIFYVRYDHRNARMSVRAARNVTIVRNNLSAG